VQTQYRTPVSSCLKRAVYGIYHGISNSIHIIVA